MAASDYARAALRLPYNQPGHYDPETHRLCITAMQASQREFADTCTYLFNSDAGAFDPWTRVEDVEPDEEGGAVLLHLSSGAVRSVPGTHPIYLGRKESEQWLAKAEADNWQVWLQEADSTHAAVDTTGNEYDIRVRLSRLLAAGKNAWIVDPLGFQEPRPALILTRDQAGAVLGAMRSLNQVGAHLDVRLPSTGSPRVWQTKHQVLIQCDFPTHAVEVYADPGELKRVYQIED